MFGNSEFERGVGGGHWHTFQDDENTKEEFLNIDCIYNNVKYIKRFYDRAV